jgi:hypothetical protein
LLAGPAVRGQGGRGLLPDGDGLESIAVHARD